MVQHPKGRPCGSYSEQALHNGMHAGPWASAPYLMLGRPPRTDEWREGSRAGGGRVPMWDSDSVKLH